MVVLGKIKISNEDPKKEKCPYVTNLASRTSLPENYSCCRWLHFKRMKIYHDRQRESGCLKTSFDMQILLRNLRDPTLHLNVTRMHTHAFVDERKQEPGNWRVCLIKITHLLPLKTEAFTKGS